MDEKMLRSAFRRGPDCPPIEVFSTRLSGDEGNDARAEALAHLEECLHCKAELELLHGFEEGVIRPGEADSVRWIAERLKTTISQPAVVPNRSWRAAWSIPKIVLGFAAAALALLLAVGISSELRLRDSVNRSVPEFSDHTVQRSRKIEVVETAGHFEWKPVPGAVRYELIVRTVDESTVFHNSFTGTSLAFPPEVDALVGKGKLLEWEVTARDSGGDEIAGSGVQQLRSPGPLRK
jgi:hypothetical protein